MDINIVLNELDNLFATNRYAEVEEFLKIKYSEAQTEGDVPSMITILNEMMGYYREATNYEAALICVKKSRELMDSLGMEGTMQYAAMLLNEANAYRAAGYYDNAAECYSKVLPIYEKNIAANDYMYATYYNNLSILYQATSEYERAKECLCKARDIIVTKPEAHIDVAVTYTNLAATLVKLNELDEAFDNLKKAKAIFDEDDPKDYHYSACLDVLGEICFKKKDYKSAKSVYEMALSEMEKTIGKDNKTYEMLLYNRDRAEKMLNEMEDNLPEKKSENASGTENAGTEEVEDIKEVAEKNESTLLAEFLGAKVDRVPEKISVIDICKSYYEEYVKEMIHNKFAEYEDKITVGIAGEGSECFGFEDDISRDHDCSLGVCLWMDKEVYDLIGEEVNKFYDELPDSYLGLKKQQTFYGKNRRGAIMTEQFYEYILGVDFHKTEYHDIEIADFQNMKKPEIQKIEDTDCQNIEKSDCTKEKFELDNIEKPDCQNMQNSDWQNIEEWKLAAATNGMIFHEADNRFIRYRKMLLGYYDEKVWRKKLAECLASVAAAGQYNYGRMMARSEYVAADMAFAKYLEEICKLVNLINRKYSPYYKWIHRSIKDTKHLPEIYDLLRALVDIKNKKNQREAWENYKYSPGVNPQDEISLTIEIIAKIVVTKLHELGITKGGDTYLQAQAEEILKLN